jgi:hypothetical protein
MNPSSTPPDPNALLDMINDLKQLLQDQQDKIATMDLQRSDLEDQLIQAANEIDSLKKQPKSNVFSTHLRLSRSIFLPLRLFFNDQSLLPLLLESCSLLFQAQVLACRQPLPQLQLFLQLLARL